MNADELKSILASHAEWLAGRGGMQADLSGANLSWASLSGADLSGANLSKADLSGANLRGATLRRADLSGANLSGANLHGANLRGANLRWANLQGATLSEANLNWVNLLRANLSDANLSWAVLLRANLTGANLNGADLSKINLTGANLSETAGLKYAQCAFDGHGEQGRQLLGVLIGDELRFFCGCFVGSLNELDEFIRSRENKYKATRQLARDFVVAALDIARTGKDTK